MPKHIFSIVLIIVLAGGGLQKNPVTLDEFDLVTRGKMSQERGNRPVQIARLDNNGEILMACLDPITADGLMAK